MLRHLRTFGLIGALSFSAALPLAAETVSECYNRVVERCDTALSNAAWWEKPAVGIMCTGLLGGCTGNVVFAE